jgi:subtilisin family serine protease
MRLRRHHYVRGLLALAVGTALALMAANQADAARSGGRPGGLSHNTTTQRTVAPRAATVPRISGSRTSKNSSKKIPLESTDSKNPGEGKIRVPPRHPTGPVVGDKTLEPGATPETGIGNRPPHPNRPTGPGHYRDRPGFGGIGPGAVTGGVAIGTGPAAAAPALSPSFSGPRGRQIPLDPRAGINIPPANEQRLVPNEVVLEFVGNFAQQAMSDLARRHRLARLDSLSLQNANSTYFRARITDGRPVRVVLQGLDNEVTLRSGQPNYLYTASQRESETDAMPPNRGMFGPLSAATPPATPVAAPAAALPALGGDPAQYALAKLRLQEAHSLTKGNNVLVAVIDSGVDAGHPELRGVITATFDAVGGLEKPHMHGTAMAGTIAARSRLMGVAPAARILAIRALGASGEGSTFTILKSIDHATNQGARVINMSFTGPFDPGLARQYAAARARGVVLVAAAGNLGPNSPPQYPAADANVIAVSATDADDSLYKASNRGRHIAVAAPGVDILAPTPDANYQVSSGTSFAAAHVSGIVALILERRPHLTPDAVRMLLLATAKDLGPIGQDDQFGAGLADAYQAILANEPRGAAAAP